MKKALVLGAVFFLLASILVSGAPRSISVFSVELLSGNTAPSPLFANRGGSGAKYRWITEGPMKTDEALAQSVQELTDGNAQSAAVGTGDGNLIIDLRQVYQVETVKLWIHGEEFMDYFEVYASLDGEQYAKIGRRDNPKFSGWYQSALEFSAPIGARYIQVYMHKDEGSTRMAVGEVAVYSPKEDVSGAYLFASGHALTEQKVQQATYQWSAQAPFGGTFSTADGGGWMTDGGHDQLCEIDSEYACVIFDLKKPWQIGAVKVWSLVDGTHFMDGFEVKYSLDGKQYFSYGFFPNTTSRAGNRVFETVGYGLPGKNARYLKIIPHTKEKMALSEIEIYAYPVGEETMEQVPLRIDLKNYVMAYLDWSAYDPVKNDTAAFRLYVEDRDFCNVEKKEPVAVFDSSSQAFQTRFYSLYPLEPEKTYYIAITPVNIFGEENQNIRAVKVTTPPALGSEPKDIFCGNFYMERIGEDNTNRIFRLLAELGNMQKNRWYSPNPQSLRQFNQLGMGHLLLFDSPVETVRQCNENGVWIFSSGNEPDLHTTPQEYLETMKQISARVHGVDERNLLSEPALTMTVESSLQWLDQLYQADGQGGKLVSSLYDVFDLHAYCKIMDGQLPGIEGYGYPEVLPSKLEKLRQVLARYGDDDKPMIFTELGWCVNEYENYQREVTPEQQRDYIVREYLIAISQGIREAYLYAVQDAGTNPGETEDNYGIIDYYGNPKPGYYGYYFLSAAMQNAVYLDTVDLQLPYYGLGFWDKSKNQYVYALWSVDDQQRSITVQGADQKIKALSMAGGYTSFFISAGEGETTLSGAPLLIYSDGPLQFQP